MNRTEAVASVSGIFNVLQDIPVKGVDHTQKMAGIFEVLRELANFINELPEEVEESR